jgi:aminopeptidase N
VPDFSAAAMENWGMITYREMALLADPKTVSQSSRELIVEVIAHEVSHQWFGNLVTMKWWNDLWLNESFANVMAFVAEDALFPEWKIWNNYIATDGLAAIRRDSIAGVQAIKIDVNHPSELNSIFDPSIVYAKGGRLIYMLMQYLGEDTFRKGLKTYFEKHAYSNTTGDDLWQALAAASKNDVKDFMEPWLGRSGFPVIKLTQNGKDLVIEQKHFLMDPTKADPDRLWPVPLLSETKGVPPLLDTNQVEVTLASGTYARVNHGAVGHYVVQYVDPEHADAVATQAAKKRLNEAERLILLNDSSMLARAGLQSFGATLQLLEHYKQEDSEPVWSIMALILADCRRFIDIDKNLEEPIKKLVRELITPQYKRLGWKESSKDTSQDIKLRALIVGMGVYAEHPEVTKQALTLFEAYKKDDQAVPAELRSVVFGAAVRTNVKGASEYLLELDESTSNTNLKQDIVDALTATKQKDQVEVLLGRLKDSNKVRQHDVDRWLAYLLRNRYGREQAWNWLRDNWKWIEETFIDDHSYDYFPRYTASAFNTPQLLNEYKTFFEPLQTQIELARSISLGIEEIENRVAWLQRDVAAVKTYLLS